MLLVLHEIHYSSPRGDASATAPGCSVKRLFKLCQSFSVSPALTPQIALAGCSPGGLSPSPAHVRIPLHTKLHLVVASGFFVQGSPGNGSAQPTSAAIAVFRATSTDLNVLSYSPANFARNRLLPAHLIFQSSRPACVSSIARAPSLRFLPTAANPTVPMARCALLDPLPMALALPAFQTSLCPRPQIHRSTPPATCAASMPCASALSWSSKRPRRTSSSTSLST